MTVLIYSTLLQLALVFTMSTCIFCFTMTAHDPNGPIPRAFIPIIFSSSKQTSPPSIVRFRGPDRRNPPTIGNHATPDLNIQQTLGRKDRERFEACRRNTQSVPCWSWFQAWVQNTKYYAMYSQYDIIYGRNATYTLGPIGDYWSIVCCISTGQKIGMLVFFQQALLGSFHNYLLRVFCV